MTEPTRPDTTPANRAATDAASTDAASTNPAALPDLRDALLRTTEWVADLVENTPSERYSEPTPCTDFTVGDLVLHLLVVTDKTVGLARTGVDPYAGDHELSQAEREAAATAAMDERVSGRSPAELAGELRRLATEARREWTDERLGRPTTVVWGPTFPGAVVVAIYQFELCAHGWDLAQGTGQDSEAPGDLGQIALDGAPDAFPPGMPRGAENGVPFDEAVPAPAGAGPTARLAAFLGRTPMR